MLAVRSVTFTFNAALHSVRLCKVECPVVVVAASLSRYLCIHWVANGEGMCSNEGCASSIAQFAIAEEVVGESWYNVALMGIWWE